MLITRSYKTELSPNNKQKTYLEKSFGTARFTFNWGLAQRIELYEKEKKYLSAIDQHKELCKIKKSEFPWMYEVSKCVPQEALKNLETAFKNFFRGLKKGGKVGFPQFKSKHTSKKSFRISSGFFYVTKSTVKLPNCGEIKLKEKGYIPASNIKYNSLTISKEADRCFASVNCEIEVQDPAENKETALGIDLGIKTLVQCSDGVSFDNPRNTNELEKKLSHVQKDLSRKVKGSKNRDKAKLRVQKVHRQIKNRRLDNLHKITSILVKTKPRYLILEDLNVAGMVQNHCLAKAIQDGSFGEIRRQLEYKAVWYGSELIYLDRFFPSSKRCRKCGKIKEDLTLGDRVYVCECGHVEDRDLNSAINSEEYGLSTLSSRGIKACGESVRLQNARDFGAVSMKQESNGESDLNLKQVRFL
jgi:putative transposase